MSNKCFFYLTEHFKKCQSGAKGLLFVRHLHWSMEEVSVDTDVKMLDAGEEEGEANKGRMD